MFASRLLSQAAAFSAAIIVSCIGYAQAATSGGANLNVTGAVTTEVRPTTAPDGLFFIQASGTFFAQSLIDDPDALRRFALGGNFTAGGVEFFDVSTTTPATSVNGLLGVVGTDFDEVVAFGAPFVSLLLSGEQIGSVTLDDPIFGLFQGLNLDFEITDFDPISSSIEGDFSVGAELTGAQLQGVQDTLVDAFGPITFQPTFAFEFNAEIAPIPLPAAFPLLLSGIAILGFAGWRRRAAA